MEGSSNGAANNEPGPQPAKGIAHVQEQTGFRVEYRLARGALAQLGAPAWTVTVEVYELAQVMIDEVADWSIMYQMHDVEY